MSVLSFITEFTDENPWAVELAAAVVCLAIGVALMPAAIFYTGAAALGKYEGATVGNLYSSVFTGIGAGSGCCLGGYFGALRPISPI